MVLLQKGFEEIVNIFENQVYSIEFGESTSVLFQDTTLTTVHAQTSTTNFTGDTDFLFFTLGFDLDELAGVDATIDSVMIYMNGEPFGKFKHTPELKSDEMAIQYQTRFILLPNI